MPQARRRRRKARRYSPAFTLILALGLVLITTIGLSRCSDAGDPTDPVSESSSGPAATQTAPSTEDTASTEATLPTDAEGIVRAYAEANGLSFADYPESLVALLGVNPETETFVLEYPFAKDLEYTIDLSALKDSQEVPLLMQWDQRWGYLRYGSDVAGLTACGPTCLSMVAIYLTNNTDYTPAYMIQYALENNYYVDGSGTSWTLFSKGAVDLGLNVEELPLVQSIIVSHLEAGEPVVCSMGPGSFTTQGHYIVLVGVEDGKFRVNDPNSRANSETLWEYADIESQIRNLWAISAAN